MEDRIPGFRNSAVAVSSLHSRLNELDWILEDLDNQRRTLEEEEQVPSREATILRQRSFLIYCAGAAVVFLNVAIASIIQWDLFANFVVTTLLAISVFIGLALMAYALLSRLSLKEIRRENNRERKSRLRTIAGRRRQTILEINNIHEMIERHEPHGSNG